MRNTGVIYSPFFSWTHLYNLLVQLVDLICWDLKLVSQMTKVKTQKSQLTSGNDKGID